MPVILSLTVSGQLWCGFSWLPFPVMEIPVPQRRTWSPSSTFEPPLIGKQLKALIWPSTITPAPAPLTTSPVPLRSGRADVKEMVLGILPDGKRVGLKWTRSEEEDEAAAALRTSSPSLTLSGRFRPPGPVPP